MVLDNSHFETMVKNHPKTLKFNINPIQYATRFGLQAYAGITIVGFLAIYATTFNRVAFPYLNQKVKREFYATPDLISKKVNLFERTIQNKITHL